jgi:hypothetical protein
MVLFHGCSLYRVTYFALCIFVHVSSFSVYYELSGSLSNIKIVIQNFWLPALAAIQHSAPKCYIIVVQGFNNAIFLIKEQLDDNYFKIL